LKEGRRHQRIPYAGPVRVSWTGPAGDPAYTLGKCIEVSESGMRVEVPVQIPLRTSILLNAERIKLSGPATVRHCVRAGAKFILGLELSHVMTDKAMAALREPWALRSDKPNPVAP
jgi:hypothetical protein